MSQGPYGLAASKVLAVMVHAKQGAQWETTTISRSAARGAQSGGCAVGLSGESRGRPSGPAWRAPGAGRVLRWPRLDARSRRPPDGDDDLLPVDIDVDAAVDAVLVVGAQRDRRGSVGGYRQASARCEPLKPGPQ